MKFKNLTDEQLLLLRDPGKTGAELAVLFECNVTTVSRWRKGLGITVPLGSKKGKARPWQTTSYTKLCKECGGEFVTTPSRDASYCSKHCQFSNDEYRKKLSESTKESWETPSEARMDAIASRLKPETSEYTRYKNRVHRLSEKVYQDNIDVINPDRHPRTIAGVEGGYQLDHIIEVRFGFDNGIPPEVLSDVSNLRILPWKENLARNQKK